MNTPVEIANELYMTRSRLPQHTLVLVEGETDKRFWARYAADNSLFIATRGKDKLVAAVALLNFRGSLFGYAGIIDPDFWLIEQAQELNMDNLLYDDLPDQELMLLDSPALDTAFINTLPIERAEEETDQFRSTALRLAMDYGYFRLNDYRHREYNLSFNQVVFNEVIDRQTLQLDDETVARKLVIDSMLSADDLRAQVQVLRIEFPSDIRLCRGRDALSFLSLLIQIDVEFSGKVKVQSTTAELSRMLRIAFDFTCFITTALYRRIRHWERDNNPFRIIMNYPLERTPA